MYCFGLVVLLFIHTVAVVSDNYDRVSLLETEIASSGSHIN